MACLMQTTDQGTAFVLKTSRREIRGVRVRLPIRVTHALSDHPAAPVIRTTITVYDQPQRPLAFETFTDVAEPDQREDFARLAKQERLLLLFYDEQLTHRLTKLAPYHDDGTIPAIRLQAAVLQARIPSQHYDFRAGKQAVIAAHTL